MTDTPDDRSKGIRGNAWRGTGAHPEPFGATLRHWRRVRGWSQLRLAEEAGVSARHIGFVELGRSQPSRHLVALLAEALQLPLRERNGLLLAAGYAPAYSVAGLDSQAASQVRLAVDFMLERHQPYPAVALNRLYDIERSNPAFGRLLSAIGVPSETGNLVEILSAARRSIVNWAEVASALRARLAGEGIPPCLEGDSQSGSCASGSVSGSSDRVLLATHLKTEAFECRLFSVISTLGTVYDVALEELRIESFFPADEVSERAILALGAEP